MEEAQAISQPLEAIVSSQPFPKSSEARSLQTRRGKVVAGCCLLTRDNNCGEHQLLQEELINVQVEVRSSNRVHIFIAVELLVDHSEGPKSWDQNTLPRKKTTRQKSEGGKGKLWKKPMVSFSFLLLLKLFANTTCLAGEDPRHFQHWEFPWDAF